MRLRISGGILVMGPSSISSPSSVSSFTTTSLGLSSHSSVLIHFWVGPSTAKFTTSSTFLFPFTILLGGQITTEWFLHRVPGRQIKHFHFSHLWLFSIILLICNFAKMPRNHFHLPFLANTVLKLCYD